MWELTMFWIMTSLKMSTWLFWIYYFLLACNISNNWPDTSSTVLCALLPGMALPRASVRERYPQSSIYPILKVLLCYGRWCIQVGRLSYPEGKEHTWSLVSRQQPYAWYTGTYGQWILQIHSPTFQAKGRCEKWELWNSITNLICSPERQSVPQEWKRAVFKTKNKITPEIHCAEARVTNRVNIDQHWVATTQSKFMWPASYRDD